MERQEGHDAVAFPAMTRAKIPPAWRELHPNDQVGTRLPLHRIEQYLRELELEGWQFDHAPSERGYWIICRRRPGHAAA